MTWGQCHPEAEPRRSSLPRGCPKARCWGSGGLCLLRCRTLELCLRPTAGTHVARCLRPCCLGFCTRVPRENPCSLGKRVKTSPGAGDTWLLPTEGWWNWVAWPWRVPAGVGAPVVRDHRSPWVQHLSPRAFLPAGSSTSPGQESPCPLSLLPQDTPDTLGIGAAVGRGWPLLLGSPDGFARGVSGTEGRRRAGASPPVWVSPAGSLPGLNSLPRAPRGRLSARAAPRQGVSEGGARRRFPYRPLRSHFPLPPH